MDNEAIFVIIYQKPCAMGCNDTEVRICRAYNKEEAVKIATEHRNKYYKGWSIAINNVMWAEDRTAYVYCDYK